MVNPFGVQRSSVSDRLIDGQVHVAFGLKEIGSRVKDCLESTQDSVRFVVAIPVAPPCLGDLHCKAHATLLHPQRLNHERQPLVVARSFHPGNLHHSKEVANHV